MAQLSPIQTSSFAPLAIISAQWACGPEVTKTFCSVAKAMATSQKTDSVVISVLIITPNLMFAVNSESNADT